MSVLEKMPPFLTAKSTQVITLAFVIKTFALLAALLFFQHYLTLTPEEMDAFVAREYFDPLRRGADWYRPFVNWDGNHYLFLAGQGYEQTPGSRHFYPLYPMLMRALGVVLPLWAAGVLLNYIFTAGFCWYLYRLGERFKCDQPLLVVLLVMAFPTAFFTSMVYSEALFLFLMLGFFYHLTGGEQSRAGLVYLALLPLTRGTAAFVFGGLLLYALLDYARFRFRFNSGAAIRQAKANRRSRLKGKAARRGQRGLHRQRAPSLTVSGAPDATAAFRWRYYLYCLLAFSAGAGAYLLFMLIATGDPLAGITAQETVVGAGNRISNIFNPLNYLNNLFRPVGGWFIFPPTILDRITMTLFLAAVLFFAVRKEWSLLCFYLPLIYAHGAMGLGHVSYIRYMLLAFPFLALALAKELKAPPLYVLCAASFVLQLYLVYRFSLYMWVA